MFSDSARRWKKGKPDTRRPPRDMLARQKRVNLAEGTSIIGQRPREKLFTSSWNRSSWIPASARVLNRCPLRRAVFADVVRLQRRWRIDAAAAADAIQSRFFTPMRPKQLQARKLARAWDKPGPVAERTSGREKRRAERFDFSVDSSSRSACTVEFEYRGLWISRTSSIKHTFIIRD